MNDPIEEVLNELRSKAGVQRADLARHRNFLHTVGEVFEREGFATTRLFLQERQEQGATRETARVLLEEVLPVLAGCERIRQNRAIGRYIIKALPTLQSPQQRRGGRR